MKPKKAQFSFEFILLFAALLSATALLLYPLRAGNSEIAAAGDSSAASLRAQSACLFFDFFSSNAKHGVGAANSNSLGEISAYGKTARAKIGNSSRDAQCAAKIGGTRGIEVEKNPSEAR